MKSREDLVKRLKEDPRYREALGRARNPAERKAIASLVESLVGEAGAILGPIAERVESDPEFREQLAKALNDRQGVVSQQSPTPVSGSNS